VKTFLRGVSPQLAERGVAVLLPDAWMRASKVRVNLKATSVGVRSSGLLRTSELAQFDWRVAVATSS